MADLALSLFGNFEVSYQDCPTQIWGNGKVQELLSYLFLNRERAHKREFLATLLWQNIPREQSRRYLRKALWQLQTPFDTLLEDKSNILLLKPNTIQFNVNFPVWCDVQILEEAFSACMGIQGMDLSNEQAQLLRRAIIVYQGDLLEGWFYDWCIIERARLQSIYLILLDRLIDYCIVKGHFDEGIGHCFRVLSFDYAHERTHRYLMKLYFVMGDRARAITQYNHCAQILKQELNVSPNRLTKGLYKQMLADEWQQIHASPSIKQAADQPEHLYTVAALEKLYEEILATQKKTEAMLAIIQTSLINQDR